MSAQTAVKDLVDVDSIQNWKTDSLYVYIDDDDGFYREYSGILGHGTYNNLKTGAVDIYGINYYAPAMIDPIIERLYKEKPTDHEVLAEWLIRAKSYNGFYILGL